MSLRHEFSLPARDLDAAGKSVRFVVRAGWIRGALEGTGVGTPGADGELDVRLSKSGTDVVVHGKLRAALTVECARCLEPARVVVNEPISALVIPMTDKRESSGSERDDDDLVPDQPDLLSYDGETVVLDELIRDELLLGIPFVPLCSDTCAGIRRLEAPEPAEHHIDPRLQPLLRLKKP